MYLWCRYAKILVLWKSCIKNPYRIGLTLYMYYRLGTLILDAGYAKEYFSREIPYKEKKTLAKEQNSC